MLHFSNQELASNYHVSVRTVRNWIEAAKAGKLDLILHNKGERTYVANTSKNLLVMDGLAQNGKKYRPHRSQKTVMPQSKFYELFTQAQLYEIVTSLEINHELPRQYNYFGEGARSWDLYVQNLAHEEQRNNLSASIENFQLNQKYIDELLLSYEQVNVIDIGVGNAMPARNFLQHLIDQGKLGKYVAIDLSPAMLQIAEKNIHDWFNGTVEFQKHELNITHDRFGYLLAEEYIKNRAEKTANVFLFLGGTIANFDNPDQIFQVLHDSMGVKDFLVYDLKLDTEINRRYFDFNSESTTTVSSLSSRHKHIFDLLNIDESLYDVEAGYDSHNGERFLRVRLKINLSIRFNFKDGERVINFNKDDTVLLWRARHYTVKQVVDQLVHNGLYPMLASHTEDKQFLMTVSRLIVNK